MTSHRDAGGPAAQGEGPGNFIAELIAEERVQGRHPDGIVTRFPPEPNGYLHIGHAKSIVLNFGLAERFDGRCRLRFDDTNPERESVEFVRSIERDVAWLGGDFGGQPVFASDYFQQLYDWAVRLVEEGKAYVDTQSPEEIREGRGSFHEPGVESPHRDRPVEESLRLLEAMKQGRLEEGAAVLRARIDMRSKDLKLRDPLMYRIRKVPHHRTGSRWNIYPMYDWAHGQSDAIEGVTHSLCTLEFVNHRGLYDWFLDALGFEAPTRPRQIEFAKLQLTYTVLSKRRLRLMVERGIVDGWDDPRMPTLSGLRRRGFTPEGIRAFVERVGVSTRDSMVDISLLEHEVREDLNARAPRRMAVLRPVKLTITNWEEGRVEPVTLAEHPEYPDRGSRSVPFGGTVWVERDDYLEDPPKKWFRLGPGREVRLRGAALVTVQEVRRDDAGELQEIRCTWDPTSPGGTASDGRKVRGTIHWVDAATAVDGEVRLYDRLFAAELPGRGGTADDPDEGAGPVDPAAGDPAEPGSADPEEVDDGFLRDLHPSSLEVLPGAKLEPSLVDAAPGVPVQFERLGYFVLDEKDAAPPERLVFNRTIALRDSWAKIAKKAGGAGGG